MQTTFISPYNSYNKKLTITALQTATFQPLTCQAALGKICLCADCRTLTSRHFTSQALSRFDKIGQKLGSLLHWQKAKSFLQVLAVIALVLPSKSLTQVGEPNSLERILITKTLKVATTDEHLFKNNTHTHGFGYDVANRYASHLGASLDIVSFKDPNDALTALKSGKVDVVISDELFEKTALATAIGCGKDLGMNAYLLANPTSSALFDNAKSYLCQTDSIAETLAMAKFYDKNTLNEYSKNHFNNTLTERLPLYKNTFKSVAQQYNHDWQVLAAISYQESHLNPTAISRTGVQGIMMLTQDTAAAMGVTDRTNAIESIHGGAKYLDMLNKEFSHIPESDRLWFVLSAYNMGPNAVRNIQAELTKRGENPKLWSNFYTYLDNNRSKNGRFVQCMHYVTNIRSYLETIKA